MVSRSKPFLFAGPEDVPQTILELTATAFGHLRLKQTKALRKLPRSYTPQVDALPR